MSQLSRLLDVVASSAERQLKRPVLVACITPQPDQSFNVGFAINGPSRGHVEAIALDLLRLLRDDLGGCPECPACQDRTVRVSGAITALEARPTAGVQ